MDHLFLYGPPGTGKSTIGKALARDLRMPFVDLDELIESGARLPVAEIMAREGEAAFRDRETAALQGLAEGPESVIALGGGALLRPENRALAERLGRVLLLTADPPSLLERLQREPKKRPLLDGDLAANLENLLRTRQAHYESFMLRLPVDGRSVAGVAEELRMRAGRHRLSAMGETEVRIRSGGIGGLGGLLRAAGLEAPLIVTDAHVVEHHGTAAVEALRAAGYTPRLVTLPPGEEHKNLATAAGLWTSFLDHGLDRSGTVVALGGGVVGDLAGFAASAFLRGVAWVTVPTTLLAMVDAALGGKTGIDLPEGKNLVGAFHPPRLVLADPVLLGTLPERELIAGLAEVVKHGLIGDPVLFDWCGLGPGWVRSRLEEIVQRGAAVKIRVIEADPYERGMRAVLNLGHTVGHAVELASGFSLRHGEAVAIGLAVEAGLSVRLGLASAALVEAIRGVLTALHLPVRIPQDLPRESILRAMRVDKKRRGNTIRLALPVEVGRVELVDAADIESILEA